MIAQNLADTLNVFDPGPLEGSQLDAYYVERPMSQLNEMRVYLEDIRNPIKVLFTGHRGSGKSTELNKLAALLRGRFFIVRVKAIEVINAADLTYVDILLAMALRLFQQATDARALSRRRRELIGDALLEDVYRWFSQEIVAEKISQPIPDTELTASVNLAMVKLEGRISREAPTRRVVRERVEHRLSELLDRMNDVLDEIARNARQRVLIMVEDIDKLDLATARDLFQDHAISLTTPRAHIIYSFPIALRNMNDFPQIRSNFAQRFILPNIRVHHRDGTDDEVGKDLLRELVWRRMDRSLIDAAALDMAVEMSGGLPRTLVLLVRSAAASARSQGLESIGLPNMEKAVTELRDDYQAVLTPEHYETLRRYRKQALMNEDAVREVLHNLSLLEYANDERWCDVHPIVEQLLQRATDTHGSGDG